MCTVPSSSMLTSAPDSGVLAPCKCSLDAGKNQRSEGGLNRGGVSGEDWLVRSEGAGYIGNYEISRNSVSGDGTTGW
jgi:hypothetical protein